MTGDSGNELGAVPHLADTRIRGRVLVVDDERSIGSFISTLLQKSGHDTRAVTSGLETLAVADEGWPDLIVLDLVMAGMDGFETAKRLKSNPQTAHIPIVMVTVLGDRESRLRGLEIGAEDFLTKPIDPAELVIRVRNLLRLKEYADFLSNMNHLLDRQVRQKTAELRGCHIETIFALARVVEFKDKETAGHISRIAHLSRVVAEMLEEKPQTIWSLSSVTTSAEKILLDLSAHNAKEIRPVLPMRAQPTLMAPGLALAAAISWARVLIGEFGVTTRTAGTRWMWLIGVKAVRQS